MYDSKIAENSETQNNPPVADLKYAILNPDSLIDGNVTTETQIGWLWSYDGQDFTYDPDGDAIVKKNVGGIPNDSIIGTFNDGSGFVTQFTTAAQYVMTFQVEDARGALSNVFSIVISVEPADGNTRPVCNIQYLYDKFDTDQVEVISWKTSTDSDDSDVITDLGFYITKEDGTQLVQNVDFAAAIVDDETLGIQFAESGNYKIWLRVVDKHNAWSDWVILNVAVSDPDVTIKDLYVSNNYHKDYDPIAEDDATQHWIDYQKSIELAKKVGGSEQDARWVLNQVESKQFPAELSKYDLGFGFVVKGTLVYREDSSPKANAPVRIYLPVTNGHGMDTTVYTDSEGKFEFNCNDIRKYFSALGYDTSKIYLGDCSGEDTRYTYYSSQPEYTIFYYPTDLKISSGNDQYHLSVSAAAGAVVNNGKKPYVYAILGNRWILTSVPGDAALHWVEIS